MPSRNTVKEFVSDSYYHLYNRGNNKQKIFLDDQDVAVFLSYLKEYLMLKDQKALSATLLAVDTPWRIKDHAKKLLRMNNFFDKITLLCYCLMPNHFHFLIHQKGENDMDAFMNSLCTRYTMYFNKKYKRVGPLFQSVYKAVLIISEEQLLYITRYIHRNCLSLHRYSRSLSAILQEYTSSSYLDYVGLRKTEWVHPNPILAFFSKRKGMTYESFVVQSDDDVSQTIVYEKTLDE